MKNVSDEAMHGLLKPAMALVLYSNGAHAYIEEHKITNGRLGAGKPASNLFLHKVAEMALRDGEGDDVPHGAIPPNLLYANIQTRTFVWWEPPGVRHLSFVKDLAIEDGDYGMPGTVFLLQGGGLKAWTFCGSRPNERSRLLYGPFFNYYEDHRMCLGTAKVAYPKDMTWQTMMDSWSGLFWNSTNNHLICNPVHGNLVSILKATGPEPFNTMVCRKSKYTLGGLIGSLR